MAAVSTVSASRLTSTVRPTSTPTEAVWDGSHRYENGDTHANADPTRHLRIPRTSTRIPPPSRTAQPSTRTATSTAIPTPEAVEEVHFIDVGQGGRHSYPWCRAAVLVDGGERGSGLVAYLRSVGIERPDTLIATHPHADHIGGLVDVLQALPVDAVVTNGYEIHHADLRAVP